MRITENQLDEWVRANARDAQGLIVELVWRLVAASCPQPRERRFPLGDSIGQHGPDGELYVDLGLDPFVPEGRSFWEIGTNLRAGDKATSDYSGLTAGAGGVPEAIRRESTFVFVTPLSGRRDWEHTWKEEAQGAWLQERKSRGEWRDVKVIDGTKLVDWLNQFPPVQLWLAQKMYGAAADQVDLPEQHWTLLRSIGEPPPLTPNIFLAGREAACEKMKMIVDRDVTQLKLETHFPDQVVDFVAAYLASLDPEKRVDATGRCIVVSGIDAWNALAAQRENLILIAAPTIDLNSDLGTKLIQKARRGGHSVVFGGAAGGIPDPMSTPLGSARSHHLQEALQQAGYSEERARVLAQRSAGNLGSLLRCLQNMSLLPQWAEGTKAADLAIAEFLGAWDENVPRDRSVVEGLSGNSYGEWIGRVREVALSPGTPLIQQDGKWRFTARFEGWYSLGPRIFDDHLVRLRQAAELVLGEPDPQFELDKDERYAAQVHGKVFSHSQRIRQGLAESLALLGTHPKALTSCTLGRPELTASQVVRALLHGADWRRWGGLNDLLPLLAEADPQAFLDAVETGLASSTCPFDELFAQEGGDGLMGRTYMSGLLWALETLAWDAAYLSRSAICLAELASRDPGGRWANRPANSLTTIFMPWLPQTCATVEKRGSAVAAILEEQPQIGWKLLISLLPSSHSTSSGTRRPAWRESISEDWSNTVSHAEYWRQVSAYTSMALTQVVGNPERLLELIARMESLPLDAQDNLLRYLREDALVNLDEPDKLKVWNELADLVAKHKKFSDTDWAMRPNQISKVAEIVAEFSPEDPTKLHRRLFSERDIDLYEERGNFEEQRKLVDQRRSNALREIAARGGVKAVVDFAFTVQSPWRVGMSYGAIAEAGADALLLPRFLESDERHGLQFVSGYVLGRFLDRKWSWVNDLPFSSWTQTQVATFLTMIPFEASTWKLVARVLGENEHLYWKKTTANPYEANGGLEEAVLSLLKFDRPVAAIRCLARISHERKNVPSALAFQALMGALISDEGVRSSIDTYDTQEVIKAFQASSDATNEQRFQVEWAYLRLMERNDDLTPSYLWNRLANDPGFFCEVIRLVFSPRGISEPRPEPTESEKAIARQAYRLLSDWRIPPGMREDKTFDGDAFVKWLESVQKECAETRHLEIAMTMLGHVLVHVPVDPDGLWIHRAVARVLNAKESGDLRNGYRAELYNSRGAHWVDPTGRPERELAEQYRQKAESVDLAGFARLAATLRDLASSYDREAEQVIAREGRFD